MKRIIMLLLSFTLIFSLSACSDVKEGPETVKFIIETDFEYSYEKNGHFRYVIMPKVADSVPESNNIIYENLVENGEPSKPDNYYPASVQSFYYNENTNKVLTQSEYLLALGTSEEQILQQFNREYGDQYTNRTYDLRHIMFWYDGNNDLQFSAYYIEQMDSNTADFHLVVNGFTVETYRGAVVGDTRSRILELYPEIDPDEQYLLNGTKDLYRLTGNGYLYLEFHLENDIVTKIIAGTIID